MRLMNPYARGVGVAAVLSIMQATRTITSTGILFVVFVAFGGSPAAQEPAKFFDDNCAMCHAIGGPPGGAPDLKDVTKRRDRAWLVRFILNPEETAKADAAAAALIKQYDGNVMPITDGATPATVEAVLRYLEAASGVEPQPGVAASARAPGVADVALGRELFAGRRMLAHRAPSCVSCHRVDAIGGLGGGALGPDLTRVHERLGGARGLTTWLGNPPTRVMKAVFRSRPLADDEQFAIAAMLADGGAAGPGGALRTRLFAGFGAIAAAAALGLIAAVWSRRMTAVRRPLVEAARHRGHES